MASKDTSDISEIINGIINHLSIGESTTALQISKDLGIGKSTVNKYLYKLHKDGIIKMENVIPPRWSKNDTNFEKTVGIGVFNDIIPKSKLDSWKGKNPIAIINEYCQFTMREWTIIVKYDENHTTYPLFNASVVISDKQFETMKGKTKQEAKYNAANVAVDAILNREKDVECDETDDDYEEVKTEVNKNTTD
ncbi:interferon resistance protein [Cotia virus SPAn232]|uniref:Interferon resistance protein n=2 Tax=Cotia virus TaxID=39444 RepID=H6TAJ6_9POXV|nr:interferon resistance protein [Cotia virus SPAn232]AFB76933.1 interferon resistance protein [Cotia virus SPAn232]AIT70666.1 interferon resistance protein [Cotia virus]